MKTKFALLVYLVLIGSWSLVSAQSKQTYTSNGTTYYYNDTYKTTGKPKVERSSVAKKKFLKSKGYKTIPTGFQIDHIVPLSEGGADVPSNMQLISIDQHKAKTAHERANRSSTYKPSTFRSTSTYKSSNNSYSKPSYSTGSSKTLLTGPKGGSYYINNNNNNKTYIKRK